MRKSRILAQLLLFSALASGCGSTSYNVRAYRAYAFEEPKLSIALDRTEDLARIFELIDRILLETPYLPQDRWVHQIPLTDSAANRIRNELRHQAPYEGTDAEIPLLKIYRVHLERVLETQPRTPRGKLGPDGREKKADSAAGWKPDSSKPVTNPIDRDDPGAHNPPLPIPAGAYPSILAALASLSQQSSDLQGHYEGYIGQREALTIAEREESELRSNIFAITATPNAAQQAQMQEAAQKVRESKRKIDENRDLILTDIAYATQSRRAQGEKGEIIRDCTVVLSVAYRLHLEALAMAPIIVVQASRTIISAPVDAAKKVSFRGLTQLRNLPDYVSSIEDRLAYQVAIVHDATLALAQNDGLDLLATAGFELRESLVDQIVGITRDSFRFNIRAGGEAFFFNHDVSKKAATSESSSNNDTVVTKDFRGRSTRLVYKIQPIVLASARLDVGFDWLHLPNAANLNFGYTTDRAYSRGGSIETSGSLGRQLGVKGIASDAFDFGLGVMGVQTSVRIARFTTGEVRVQGVNPADDTDTGGQSQSTALQLNLTQVDVGYDTAFLFAETAGRYYVENLVVGFRYLGYSLPRILYELEDVNPSPKVQDYRFVRESPPQAVQSQYYMGGLMARFGAGQASSFSLFGDLGFYMGAGPASYYFLRDSNQGDIASNRENFSKSAIAVDATFGGGFRYRLTPGRTSLRLNLEGLYRAELIYSTINVERASVQGATKDSSGVEVGRNRIVEFGGTDIFHGPRFQLSGVF